jgi:hypothetical protein
VLSFVVYEPPHPPADRLERATNLVFVKDGFSWPAALFTPLWLLGHRLWWPLLGYLAAVGLVTQATPVVALQRSWVSLALAGLSFLIGLEAAPLRMWSLSRRGFSILGPATGRTTAECERRFISAWLPSQPALDLGADAAARRRGRWWRRSRLSTGN